MSRRREIVDGFFFCARARIPPRSEEHNNHKYYFFFPFWKCRTRSLCPNKRAWINARPTKARARCPTGAWRFVRASLLSRRTLFIIVIMTIFFFFHTFFFSAFSGKLLLSHALRILNAPSGYLCPPVTRPYQNAVFEPRVVCVSL